MSRDYRLPDEELPDRKPENNKPRWVAVRDESPSQPVILIAAHTYSMRTLESALGGREEALEIKMRGVRGNYGGNLQQAIEWLDELLAAAQKCRQIVVDMLHEGQLNKARNEVLARNQVRLHEPGAES